MQPFQQRRWAACAHHHLHVYEVSRDDRLRHRRCLSCKVTLGHGSTTRAQKLMQRTGRRPRPRQLHLDDQLSAVVRRLGERLDEVSDQLAQVVTQLEARR